MAGCPTARWRIGSVCRQAPVGSAPGGWRPRAISYDYMIKVAVNGTRGYEELLRHRLYRVPGIRHSRSSFALRCIKQGTMPIPE
jgi:DNA-binding Lrp family transcriptional regulator